ncbi:MAG: peptidoglycan-associated lipoprotein Pal [Thermoanaerobaculia bacterium]
MKNRILVVMLTFVALLGGACRSKVKPATAPPPPPVVEPAEVVAAPVGDFTGGLPAEDEIDMSDLDALNELAQEKGWVRDVFFDYDSVTLTESARDALSASAGWLKERPELGLTIEGHCDERGTSQYNLALGEKRAWAARQYLETLGIASSRLRTMSFGEERPFATGSNETAWAQNRRAHLVLFRVE